MTICNKPLTSAPPRLQRLLIKIQGYNFSVAYKQGSSMILADALSRLPNPTKRDSIPLDLHIDDIDLSDNPTTEDIDLVHFGCSKRETLRQQTACDPVMRELQQVIYTGWPESVKNCHPNCGFIWPYRDELGVSSGVIFKGIQVIIPEKMRNDILSQLDNLGHLGIE